MSDPVARARAMAELMSESMNLLGLLLLPGALEHAGIPVDANGVKARALSHVEKLAEALGRGGIHGPPGFDAAGAVTAIDELRAALVGWDARSGAPGDDVKAAARRVLGALGLPSSALPG